MTDPLLDVQHLSVDFKGRLSTVTAVDDVSFQIAPGETLGLVGESGSGKSVTAFTILRLLQPPGRVTAGRVMFEGRDLLALPERDMRRIRGARISLIFQEPMTALNPVMRVGDQIAEALTVHGRTGARERAVELLNAVHIPDAERRVRDYPHQLSGGMRQRAMIAIALACHPALLIADEPTTALDVTIQAQVLGLLRELRAQYSLALLLITHDFGVIAEVADRVAVMYRGTLVEQGPVRQILRAPAHDYTRSLLAAVPGAEVTPPCAMNQGLESTRVGGLTPSLLEVRHLVKYFVRKRGLWRAPSVVTAVDDVSFAIEEGEMFGLVGESGSGKSTTGRCILRLVAPSSGEVLFRGENVLQFSRPRMRLARRDMQIVFQDPYSSLNPRMRAGDIVEEPLIIHTLGSRTERRGRVADLFDLVGLDPDHLTRYPHEFSGGQRQRIGIARALALNPALIIADEAVSALDVSIQAQVVRLMLELQARLKLTYLFIAHDLRLVEHICSRVAVMYLGKIVEMGDTRALFANPTHPYTRSLLSAVPMLDPDVPRQRISLDPESFDRQAPLKEVGAAHLAAV